MGCSNGVYATIQAERLAQARRLLEDTRERRSVREIAESVGFFEPSVFSRAFRRRYDATPSDVREAARAGLPRATGSIARASARGFLDLVSRLEG
ncbi:helix-turn-helix domain-containing protein [Roseomonas fluvialis]|uniref:helix-turn-helix domain-containing protein n=1 Tax=Roseomonas fluvialis TaxID=1750527 RepID=UPI00311AB9C1